MSDIVHSTEILPPLTWFLFYILLLPELYLAMMDQFLALQCFIHCPDRIKTSLSLSRYFWPWLKWNALSHDSYSCERFPNTTPFPTQRKMDVHTNYAGALFSPKFKSLDAKCPPKCRPKNNQDWIYCWMQNTFTKSKFNKTSEKKMLIFQTMRGRLIVHTNYAGAQRTKGIHSGIFLFTMFLWLDILNI